jgi:hypothetical protein
MSDPRNNADDAYAEFMAMERKHWLGLLVSVTVGRGVLTEAEREGFERAERDRRLP